MRHRLVLPLFVAACLSLPAYAQINPFRGSSGTPLDQSAIQALTDATNRLLDRPKLGTGATETWNDPASGAGGTVTAGAALHRKGLGCRVVRYQHTVPGPSAKRDFTLTWCKTKDGWKIS